MSCPICSACPRCHRQPWHISIRVPGEPASWQVGTRRRPSKTLRPWKELVAWTWRQVAGAKRFTGPVRIDARLSTGNKRKDLDNMVKAIVDGLKNVALEDDTRVYCLVVWKEPADVEGGAEVTLSPYHGPVFEAHLGR